jgi:4-amino-4-deoxy-L-arabinose transferase-like glycosyltransferase
LRFTRPARSVRIDLALVAIVAIAFVIRTVWMVILVGCIDSEGAEYVRIAQNLLAGNGYVGIITPGTELMFPPLFPLLIAAGSLMTGAPELTARMISVSMGALLVCPVYFIARHLYNRSAGLIAASIVAVHPLLAGLSANAYVEPTDMTLVMTAIWLGIKVWERHRIRDALLLGCVLALAYLARQEAIVLAVLFALLFAVAGLWFNRPGWRWSLAMLAAFVVVAGPYIGWLSAQTGQFRIEGKAPINYAVGIAQYKGLSEGEAKYAIDENLNGTGVVMRSQLTTIRDARFRPTETFHFATRNAERNIPGLIKYIVVGASIGSPFLFAIAVLGFFGAPWRRGTAIGHAFLLLMLGVAALALLSIDIVSERYFLLFVPALVIWTSIGLVRIADWAAGTFQRTAVAEPQASGAGRTAMLIGAAGLVVLSAVGAQNVHSLSDYDYRSKDVRAAGEWLRQIRPNSRVMDASAILPFHALATWVPFPYTEASLAIKYIDKQKVDFIVFRQSSPAAAPYWQKWFEDGIPDPRARLVYNTDGPRGRILIYEVLPHIW